MDMCVLRPPNSRQFSDDVITSVVQRSRSIRNSLVAVANVLSPDAEYHPAQHSDAHTPDRNSYPTREMGVTPPERWRATSPQSNSTCMAFTDQKRKREHLQSSVSMSSPTAGGGVPEKTVLVKHEDQLAVMARLVISEKQRIRELRRMRQIRYRKKKDNYALSLEEEARRLREEIEKLAQERRAATAFVSTHPLYKQTKELNSVCTVGS
ncbi:hypothetical protein KRP22_011411 [Phytophthora ramorum]|nr:hypothetical protein KRP22_10613 [Phytophthora ramorum]